MQPQLPTPLPPNEIALKGEMLAPLPGEGSMVWGSWSPDSDYFLLGQRDGKIGRTGGLAFGHNHACRERELPTQFTDLELGVCAARPILLVWDLHDG